MARTGGVLFCCLLLFQHFEQGQGITHWVVTEDGRISSQSDSIFNMRRPDDLVALLKQDERSVMLNSLKKELLHNKEDIDRNEDKDTGLEQRFYKSDGDCILAGKPLPEFDLYISTVLPLENKGIRPEDHIDFKAPPSASTHMPYCTEVMDLDFSMHAFEHLEGMHDRQNLSGSPELGLKNAITHRDNVDDYGNLIYEALKKNQTSWVLYNMAAFYWRIQGDPYHVVECLRRALHFSPRLQKDVALISLANVLHRSRYSNEAAIVVHAALEVSRELNVNHFTLGNIYAVLAEYNKSVICFENTLKIQPDFEAAAKRKYAVLCHAKLEAALEAQHRSLQRTLSELRDYQRKHEYWQEQHDKILTEQASADVKLEQRVAYERLKIQETVVQSGEFCRMTERDGRQVLQCSWGRREPADLSWDRGWNEGPASGASRLIKATNLPPLQDYSKPLQPPLFYNRRPDMMDSSVSLSYQDPDWPDKAECDLHVQRYPQWNEFPTTYLPPENKGFEVKALLSLAQGLKKGTQHPLPWYPPGCVALQDLSEGLKSLDNIASVQERAKAPTRVPDLAMRLLLLSMADEADTTEEEVGQRILTALRENIGPSWLLYNLAGLYWRVNGNHHQGIECLRRSLAAVPDEYRDVPLVNLANILYKWGRVDDAVTIMQDAIAVNHYEPETHFFLGNLLSAKGNLTGAIAHYQEALHQQPEHEAALNGFRILRCYERFHRSQQSVVRNVAAPGPPTADCPCGTKPGVAGASSQCKKGEGESCANGNGNGQCTKGTCPTCNTAAVNTCSSHDPNKPVTTCVDPSKVAILENGALMTGEECEQMLVQAPTQRPHTRLEVVDGILHQKFIFVEAVSDIPVTDTDCVVFNDGSKTQGCSREEFKPFDFDNMLEYEVLVSKSLHPSQDDHHGNSYTSDNPSDDGEFVASCQGTSVHSSCPTCRYFSTDNVEDNLKRLQMHLNQIMKYTDEDIIRINPDPSRHLVEPYPQPWPSWEECRENYQQIDFSRFTSTWVSVSITGIDLSDQLDFDAKITEFVEPQCNPDLGKKAKVIDMLDSVVRVERLKYGAEEGLLDTLQSLGPREPEAVEMMATRIAHALTQNPSSWVAANLAALYWRVQGQAEQAITCIKVAYSQSVGEQRPIALLSLSNILYKSGRLDEAQLVVNMALESAPRLVSAHFTMANICAALSDFQQALNFYDSTLNLQSTFPAAQARQFAIQCDKILSNPHMYSNNQHLKGYQ